MFDQFQFSRKTPTLRNKLLIALALVCTLCFGSISIANAQCGGGSMKMGKRTHRTARHGRKHGRGHKKQMANANMMSGNANH
jgi:hypothetical protein